MEKALAAGNGSQGFAENKLRFQQMDVEMVGQVISMPWRSKAGRTASSRG